MKRRKWTLVEVMIVAAIMAILGAIAFPELFANRRTAMNRVKTENVKLIASAVCCYLASNPNGSMKDIDSVNDLQGYLASGNDTEADFVVAGQPIKIEDGIASYPDSP